MRPGELRLNLALLQRLQRVEPAAPQSDLLSAQFRQIIGPVVPVRRVPAGWADPCAEIIMSVEMPLADIGGVIAAGLEQLAHRVDIAAQRQIVRPGAGSVGVNAGEERRPRRRTERAGRVGALEQHAVLRQAVEVGRVQLGASIRADHVCALRIGEQEDEVGG